MAVSMLWLNKELLLLPGKVRVTIQKVLISIFIFALVMVLIFIIII